MRKPHRSLLRTSVDARAARAVASAPRGYPNLATFLAQHAAAAAVAGAMLGCGSEPPHTTATNDTTTNTTTQTTTETPPDVTHAQIIEPENTPPPLAGAPPPMTNELPAPAPPAPGAAPSAPSAAAPSAVTPCPLHPNGHVLTPEELARLTDAERAQLHPVPRR